MSPKTVELAVVDYIEAYPAYVTMVYKTFDPFDYETGEGDRRGPSGSRPAASRPVRSGASSRSREDLGRAGTALDPTHRAGRHRQSEQGRQEMG